MLVFMKKKVKEFQEQKQTLMTKANDSQDLEEVKSINKQLETLNASIAEYEAQIQKLENPNSSTQKLFNPLATYTIGGDEGKDNIDATHRKAFMEYVLKGKAMPEEYTIKTATTTADIGAVIPTTIINKIVEKLNAVGMIYSRVTKTSYPAGFEIPTSSAKPVATWVAEGTGSEQQKKNVTGKITFTYHKLQCKVAITLESSIVSLAVFEQTVINNMTEAMLIAIESAIVSGDGSGKPKGFLKENVPADRIAEATEENIGTYEYWVGVESKVPLAYASKGVYVLAKNTWDKYCVGMVDKQGQPIARITYGIGGVPELRLLGREVILTDYVNSFDASKADEVFGSIVNLSDYLLNSTMQMTFKNYEDNENDNQVKKATAIVDGKMVDTNGLVYLKKKVAVQG